FLFSSRRRHTRCYRDWSSDVCSSDLAKRVLNDWTQTTLAAHRGNATRADSASSRSNIAGDVAQALRPEEVRSSRKTMEKSAGLRSEERRVGDRESSAWTAEGDRTSRA